MMTFEVYQDKAGEWRWRLKSRNGRIVGDSSEGYHNEADCKGMIGTIVSDLRINNYKIEMK